LRKRPGSFCILGCGGDGTIGWICEELDKLHFKEEESPCVSVSFLSLFSLSLFLSLL